MARTFTESLRSRQGRPERAEVRRSIPRTSIQRAEEGRVDSKHVEDLSQHLECTRINAASCSWRHAQKFPCYRERKTPRVSKVKCLRTREFAVSGSSVEGTQPGSAHQVGSVSDPSHGNTDSTEYPAYRDR